MLAASAVLTPASTKLQMDREGYICLGALGLGIPPVALFSLRCRLPAVRVAGCVRRSALAVRVIEVGCGGVCGVFRWVWLASVVACLSPAVLVRAGW